MNLAFKKTLVFLFTLVFQCCLAQSVDLYQKQLPYTIPVIQSDTATQAYEWRWLENGAVIPGADSSAYIVPAGKAAGSYLFINEVKCGLCADWLSSNPFTVVIHSNPGNPTAAISATFSPQFSMQGYLQQLISVIDNTRHSLDISLYHFESYEVYKALERATTRGVKIRLLYDEAQEDRKSTEGTVSHQVENTGADIRYVNKINHHKFLISDAAFLVSSSGNWNDEANSVYDENTLWINDQELALRYRAEFEYLWNYSRPFGLDFGYAAAVNPDSLRNLITDNAHVDALFTSANYRTYHSNTRGPTFALVSGNQKVAARIVQLIEQSQRSISIAANHLRSRPISEALIAKKKSHPGIDIKVYLDGQEYISKEYNDIQLANRAACLSQASTPGDSLNCKEKDFYHSYELIKAGIDVRFKTYAYKWHQNTAAMMHHKYAIFDDSVVATGSYNYSYNAETGTMENVTLFDGEIAPGALTAFITNFESIWNTGRQENFYNDIQSHISSDSRFIPVLFPPMALSYDEVRLLRAKIESAAPTVKDPFFNNNKEYFSTYLRGVGLGYDSLNRLVSATDIIGEKFVSRYAYNEFDAITEAAFQSSDSIAFEESYAYDQHQNLVQLNSPQFDLTLTYSNSELATLDAGQGSHAWTSQGNAPTTSTHYSTPATQDYLVVKWNENEIPVRLSDADSRTINWEYGTDDGLSTIKSNDQNIVFINNDVQQKTDVVATSGEGITYHQPDIDEITVSATGTVDATVQYATLELADKKVQLDIQVNSNKVVSGKGKTASLNYLLDPYGRVVKGGNMTVMREPYSGNIIRIVNEGITETRSYNDWELLTSQLVTYQNQNYYEAHYQYDGLQRIKSATEIVQGVTSVYTYSYDPAGRLEKVYTK